MRRWAQDQIRGASEYETTPDSNKKDNQTSNLIVSSVCRICNRIKTYLMHKINEQRASVSGYPLLATRC